MLQGAHPSLTSRPRLKDSVHGARTPCRPGAARPAVNSKPSLVCRSTDVTSSPSTSPAWAASLKALANGEKPPPRATATLAASAVTAAANAAAAADLSLEPFKNLLVGKTFKCTQCGKCCTGEGEIWMSSEECAKVASYLNMGVDKFVSKYMKQYDRYTGWRMIKMHSGSNDCIFLKDNKCSIHPVRPSQCSTYPWWPELTVQSEWDWEKANVCEGFDHAEAEPLDLDEAARQLRIANKMTQLRVLANRKSFTKTEIQWLDQVIINDPQDTTWLDEAE